MNERYHRTREGFYDDRFDSPTYGKIMEMRGFGRRSGSRFFSESIRPGDSLKESGYHLLKEDESKLVYLFKMPGVPKENINLRIDNNCLSLSAKYDLEGLGGEYNYDLEVPHKISKENITTNYKDGVLRVEIKKIGNDRGEKIDIR